MHSIWSKHLENSQRLRISINYEQTPIYSVEITTTNQNVYPSGKYEVKSNNNKKKKKNAHV